VLNELGITVAYKAVVGDVIGAAAQIAYALTSDSHPHGGPGPPMTT
jgi:hypothetical protein